MPTVKEVPSNKWVTIGSWYSFPVIPRELFWKVQTSRQCSWRRIALIPWGGTFVKSHSAWFIKLGIMQVKSPEATICVSSFDKSDVDNYPL